MLRTREKKLQQQTQGNAHSLALVHLHILHLIAMHIYIFYALLARFKHTENVHTYASKRTHTAPVGRLHVSLSPLRQWALKTPRGSSGPLGLNPINGCRQSRTHRLILVHIIHTDDIL